MKKVMARILPVLLTVIMIISFAPGTSANEIELPYSYDDAINLGPAALASKAQGVAIGEGELYYAINGDPARFYAADSETGEVIFTQSLPNSDVVWGMTVGNDGNVYFSGTFDGILYRYNVEEETLDEVGINPSDDWVWQLKSTNDGKIYGATYPNAKVFEYDIVTEEFIDLGTFQDGQDYARGIGVTDDNLYVGIGTTASLHKMNRETGERTEINLPITGEQTSVSNIWEYNDYLFIAYGTSLLTLDKSTEEVVHEMYWEDLHTFDGLISAPSPYDEDLLYFRDKQTGELWTYDMNQKSLQAVEPKVQLPGSALKDIKWIKDKDGNDVLAMFHHQLEYSIFNPETNELSVVYPEAEMEGLTVQSIELGPDNNLYIGGYQGSFGIFDTDKEEYVLQERDPHQIEGIGFLNDKVYLGTYGGARIFEYDPALPFTYSDGQKGDNPAMVYGIPDAQSRPFTFATGEEKLYVGTISDYGKLGGSLATYNALTDEWTSKRNVVEDQSIIGLAYDNGILYGGTTIAGGLGVSPTQDKAKMFTYDEQSATYDVFDLAIDGLATPKMIGELSIGPDNNLWGIAHGLDKNNIDNSVVFAMDMQTREIVKQKEFYAEVAAGSSWRPFYIRWDDQGFLYTTAGRKLTVIDPESMESKQLLEDNVEVMDLDEQGNIYYAVGADVYKLPATLRDNFIEKNVVSVEELQMIAVHYGTKQVDIALPATVKIILSDYSTLDVAVNWDDATPKYNSTKAGTYTFTGELAITDLVNIVNPDNITTSIDVEVAAEEKEEVTSSKEENGENNEEKELNNDEKITPSDPNEVDPSGEQLPKTATNNFNFILIGFILLIIGGTTILIVNRKNKNH